MSAPEKWGYAKVWSDEFDGPAGNGPDRSKWTLQLIDNYNGEIQQYTDSPQNAQLSGQGQLLIIPLKSPTGAWTSARLEGKHAVGCDPNNRMIFQAEIRVGQNDPSHQQGVWPAFWTLGDSINHGTKWPQCGEWDILEFVNGGVEADMHSRLPVGQFSNQATLHYGNIKGEHESKGDQPGRVSFTQSEFHTWSVEVDCSLSDISKQTVNWQLDGKTFFTVNGGAFTSGFSTTDAHSLWAPVANTPFFPILNVAIGGQWPGAPNDQTQDGIGSGLTVNYVAIYKQNGPIPRDDL